MYKWVVQLRGVHYLLFFSLKKLQEVPQYELHQDGGPHLQQRIFEHRYHRPINTLKRLISSPTTAPNFFQSVSYSLVYRNLHRISKMAANRGKRVKVCTDSDQEGYIQFFMNLDKLRAVQDDLKKVNEEASNKIFEVEQKYNERQRPIYGKRSEIIKSIPDFWLKAFLCHPVLGDLLSEEDRKMFKYLDSIDIENFKGMKSGYSITFNFKTNHFFEDTELTKTFTVCDDGTTKITGTTIKWKEGMETANGESSEKGGNKQLSSDESFFSWFSETHEKYFMEGICDEVAEIIKEDLWRNPLKYFKNDTGEEDSARDEDGDEEKEGNDDEADDDKEDNNKEDGV